MILLWIVVVFFVGGLLAWFSERWGEHWPRWISLIILIAHMGLLLALWTRHVPQIELLSAGPWLIRYNLPWIPRLGISFYLGIDGLSLLLIVLSNLLGIVAVGCSWTAIRTRVGFFHFNLLFVLSAIAGLFMALDLFLFYVFWEVLLIPLYFLILLWGYPARRTYAAVKFFIFTQSTGLLMLLAILGLYVLHGRATGTYTFDYLALLGTPMDATTARWLMLGFFVAFAVKLPAVPLHTWLPDAHAEAPTAGSVYLAGLVLKVGAYGMLRFVLPLFPGASREMFPLAMALGIAGIVYAGVVAFGQTDLKRLVAYTSINHMGFVLLGIFAWNQLALEGALVIMLAHGLSTGALFVLAGDLSERLHTRELARMGGFWSTVPRMGGVAMVLALASLGLPGLGNFVGEFLVLLGLYRVSVLAAVLASVGFVISTVYSLAIIQRVFHGPPVEPARALPDMTTREASIMALMIALLVWLGFFPQTVLNTGRRALEDLQVATTRAPRIEMLPPTILGPAPPAPGVPPGTPGPLPRGRP